MFAAFHLGSFVAGMGAMAVICIVVGVIVSRS